jgi:hypothetical protein
MSKAKAQRRADVTVATSFSPGSGLPFERGRPDNLKETATMKIIEHSGEPRIVDVELADRLGFTDRRMIRRLIERHGGALSAFGEVSVTVTETTALGGRPGHAYLLNRKQALYICAKSETPRAAEVTIQMVEVFDRYLEGKTVHVEEHWRRPPRPRLPVEEPKHDVGLRHFTVGTDNPRIARALLSLCAQMIAQGEPLTLR